MIAEAKYSGPNLNVPSLPVRRDLHMNSINLFFAAACSLIFVSCATSELRTEPGYVSLFDGKTLNGWTPVERSGSPYFVKDGSIVCPADGANYLFTTKEYSDFVLRLDFKLSPGANNGIAFRAPLESGETAYIGNEVQILDDAAPQYAKVKNGQNCGSLYRVFEAKRGAV